MERYATSLEIHKTAESGEFEGLASRFGSMVDSFVPTVIEPGAFKNTLENRARGVKLLWMHDPAEPIGVPIELRETQDGLFVRGKISATDTGKAALILLKDKVVDEMSIGFDAIRYENVEHVNEDGSKQMVRHIKELNLWEISLVTFAADPGAKVTAVHAYHGHITAADRERRFEQALTLLGPAVRMEMALAELAEEAAERRRKREAAHGRQVIFYGR